MIIYLHIVYNSYHYELDTFTYIHDIIICYMLFIIVNIYRQLAFEYRLRLGSNRMDDGEMIIPEIVIPEYYENR